MPKALQNWPWRLSEVAGAGAAGFSKEKCTSQTYLAGFKTGEIGPGWFSKALSVAPRNLLSNGSEGFELSGFD
jgi:hypothetical protein